MKRIGLHIALIFLLISNVLIAQRKLEVTVTNIQSSDGELYVGLFNKAQDFPDKDNTFKYMIVQAEEGSLTLEFQIPEGNYAVSVFHDANANGTLDTNFLGAPTEYYGFSNNARGLFSAPTFEDCTISYPAVSSITIQLH